MVCLIGWFTKISPKLISCWVKYAFGPKPSPFNFKGSLYYAHEILQYAMQSYVLAVTGMKVTVMVIYELGQIYPTKGSILKI